MLLLCRQGRIDIGYYFGGIVASDPRGPDVPILFQVVDGHVTKLRVIIILPSIQIAQIEGPYEHVAQEFCHLGGPLHQAAIYRGVNVGNVENLDQLFDRLAAGLRMRDYFGYAWEQPRDWRAFADALAQMPLPQTFEVLGFARFQIRMPLEAGTMASFLKQAAARVDNATIEFK